MRIRFPSTDMFFSYSRPPRSVIKTPENTSRVDSLQLNPLHICPAVADSGSFHPAADQEHLADLHPSTRANTSRHKHTRAVLSIGDAPGTTHAPERCRRAGRRAGHQRALNPSTSGARGPPGQLFGCVPASACVCFRDSVGEGAGGSRASRNGSFSDGLARCVIRRGQVRVNSAGVKLMVCSC